MKEIEEYQEYNEALIYTEHALGRLRSRGISKIMISDTIEYGELIYKQGVRFYVMLKKTAPKIFNHNYIEKILGITVLVSNLDNTIITVYKNKNSFKTIKKKSKRARNKRYKKNEKNKTTK